ncbi:MAG: glycine betaine/L-proline ABC transporter ATP-binding protein [Rhizobiales bacterium]|nr:glycine betaine/L-proline ABC transporter ATP-binding protein [Hyphomicrobiales bacterium]NRB12893.1 glycine betaine/L-proline ABC transporter ATP-binding protein [Hyphomicrobiales bacterium]
MSKPLIQINGLYKVFGKHPEKTLNEVKQGISKKQLLATTGHTIGLKNINLEINKGEIFVFMGLSGSGKSTLVRHFNRLIDPTEGEILIDGDDIMAYSQTEIEKFRQTKVSMVFQNFALMPHITVLDNVCYGLKVKSMPIDQQHKIGKDWLEKVGLVGYENQYPNQLSGGQKQRVGLARALAVDADILLMDEAFSALDPLIRSEMQDQLIQLQADLQKTIIFITHDLDEALKLGDRIAILNDGELVQQDTPQEILLNPANDYVERFVKDVNRAKVLTVESIMQDVALIISDCDVKTAYEKIKALNLSQAFYFNGSKYSGVVALKRLKDALEAGRGKDAPNEFLEDSAKISISCTVEDVFKKSLQSEYMLPIFDGDGNLVGQLSTTDLNQAF